jgi:branched-chain amino acid aminotransferase
MGLKVYLDGKLVEKDDAKVSVYDHGLLYGDGVFEGIRCYCGKVFQMDAHIRRLYDSAKAIRLDIPMTQDAMKQALVDTLKANNLEDAYIRLIVTRGVGCLGVSPVSCKKPSVIIITDSISLYPAELYETGMAVITSSIVRNHPNALSPQIKSLNYLNNILAKLEAIDAGVAEAIMFNHLGFVSECTGDNVFIVRDGKIFTPPPEAGLLEGITRDAVIKLAREQSIPVIEQNVTRYDLYTADECFLTGTAAEVIPVTKIDGRVIGGEKVGPITLKLIDTFTKFVRNQ